MENKKINEYEIDNESKINEIRAKRIAAIALALTAGGASALTGCSNNTQNVKNETKVTKETKEQENVLEDLEKEITKKYESFSEENKFSIMESILRGNAADNKYENATEAQKKFYNKIENFIIKFHEQTHKENNFRIAEDGEHYLDLSIWEVACLDLLLNDYSKEELSEIWGNITVDEKSLTEVTQTALVKIITYYTNAKEKSGVAELIEDKEKKAAFEKQEEKVLAVNKNASEENLNAIIDSPEYQEVYLSNNTNLEKMDLASFISTIPLVSFTIANLDAISIKEIYLNNSNLGLEIMGKKAPELAKNLTEVSEKIEKEYDEAFEKDSSNKETKLENYRKTITDKIKDIYGVNIDDYVKEEEMEKFIGNYYSQNIVETNFGLTFDVDLIINEKDTSKLENYNPEDEEALKVIYKNRHGIFSDNYKVEEQSYNKEEKTEEKAKVRCLKRHI